MSDASKPPQDPTLQQVTLAWGDTLHGDQTPGQTIKCQASLRDSAGVPQQMRTASIALGPEPEALGPPSTLSPPPGRSADYELKRLLGQGGMGVVYAARQFSLERDVALKLPRPGGSLGEQRFVQEARVTGNLDHPNIVPVHELGRAENGRLYLAMKLVNGTPWSTLLHSIPRRPLREHLEILLKVADAVAFAHARGILHRDLKPENVMVGEFGEVLVMDWGLALEVALARGASSAAGLCVGTPAYMPPEQALGQGERLGVWSDVYLLGAILYEILTGSAPHRGPDVLTTLVAAARGEIEPPERLAPRELVRVALKALAARPEERFQDVASFQEALRAFLAHEESLRLGEEGLEQLEGLGRQGQVPLEERYAVYTRALAALGQALHLWDVNEEARQGQARAALALANEALDRGDPGLAAAQLPVLHQNPATDRAGLLALEAALAVRRASRLRSAAAAALMLVALLACALLVGAWRESVREDAAKEAARSRGGPAEPVRVAWNTARSMEPLALARQRGGLDDAWLRWAEELLLWRAGRWSDLSRTPLEAHALGLTPQARPSRPSDLLLEESAEPSPECLRLRALISPPWARGVLGAGCKSDVLSERAFWPALYDAVRTGLPPEALARILDARGDPVPAADAPRAWIVLSRGAAAHFGREAAVRRGDAATAARLERFIPPYRLASPPFGSPASPRREPPRLVEQPEHSWLAKDARSGEFLWRSLPLTGLHQQTGVSIPVDDGSVIVSAANQLVRLSGHSGAVLGRVRLDGQIAFAWPDPADRSRLVALIGADGDDRPRTVSIQGGTVEGLYQEGGLTTPAGPGALRGALFEEAAGLLGVPQAQAEKDEAVRSRALAGLRHATELDPDNPELWLLVLEGLPAAAPLEERRSIARRVAAATGLLPREAVALGVRLEAAGFSEQADGLYSKGAAAFLEHGGNTDLTSWSPAVAGLRSRVRASVRSGDVARVIANVEMGRRFASYVEGDQRFYRQYAQWLRQQGRSDVAAALEPRLAESGEYGGAFSILPGRFLLALDVALFVLVLAPWALLALVARAFLHSWATRNADLHARGWRTAGQRLLAFFTHPVDRLQHIFLSYASRAERFSMAALGVVILAAACVLAGTMSTIGNVASIARSALEGYAGSDAALRALEAERAQEPRAATLRLLAEGYRARALTDRALELTQLALQLSPADAQALNNTAVLAEEAGRRDAALVAYERAARDDSAGAAVARYNLARLSGDQARTASARQTLAHRDLLRAEHFGPARALWAMCPPSDLGLGLARSRSVLDRSIAALRELALRPPGRLLRATLGGTKGIFMVATGLLDAFGALAWICLLALVWMPFPVRPVSPAGRRRVVRPWLRRVGLGLAALVGLVLPGTWDLLLGRATLDALIQLVSVGAFAISQTVRSGGFFTQFLVFRDEFPEVPGGAFYPELAGAGRVATVLLVVIVTLNLVVTLRRAWRAGVFVRTTAGGEP